MPEITFDNARVVAIPGQEVTNDNGVLTDAVTKCQLLDGDENGLFPNAAGGVAPLGVALEKGEEGETIAFAKEVEVAGFDTTDLVANELVYPSEAVEGGLATGAEAATDAPAIGRISPDLKRIFIRCL